MMKLSHKTRALSLSALMAAVIVSCGGEPSDNGGLSQTGIEALVDGFPIQNSANISPEDFIEILREDGADWAAVEILNDAVIFSQLDLSTGLSLEHAHLTGLAVLNDHAPLAQKVEFSKLETDEVTIGSGVLNFPSGATLDAYVEFVTKDGEVPDPNPDMMLRLLDVFSEFNGGGYFNDFQTQEVSIEFLGWKSDRGSANLSFVAQDIEVDQSRVHRQPDDLESFQIESVTLKNFNLDFLEDFPPGDPAAAGALVYSLYNPFVPMFEHLEMKNITAESEQFGITMPELVWGMTDEGNDVHLNHFHTRIVYNFDGLFYDNVDPALLGKIEDAGLWPMSIALSSESRVDKVNDIYQLIDGRMSMNNKLDLAIGFKIEGADKMFQAKADGMTKTFQAMTIFGTGDAQTMAAGISETMMAGWTHVVLHDMNLIMTENDFLDEVLALIAQEEGEDVEGLREQFKASLILPTLSAQTSYQSELAMDYAEAARAFADQGGSLQISTQMPQGLVLMDVYDDLQSREASGNMDALAFADDILRQLNIEFEHIAPR